jgi:hypothetical protein
MHVQIPVQRTGGDQCLVGLGFRHEDFAVRKMPDAAGMVTVHVRHDDPAYIGGIEA